MNNSKNPLPGYIRDTILTILLIAIPIVLKVMGLVNMETAWFVGLNFGVFFLEIFLQIILNNNEIHIPVPIYTICFIVMKVVGWLMIGWLWIIVALVLDVVFCFTAKDALESTVGE